MTREDAEKGMRFIIRVFREFGLTIHTGRVSDEKSTSKTEILYVPIDCKREYESFGDEIENIDIDGDRFVSYCSEFKYLGSEINYTLNDDHDVNKRITKARQLFYAWREEVYQDQEIPVADRVKFYKALVINTLLWGCESWALKKEHIRKLEAFHHTCLRSILRISKLQRIRNVEIRRRANNVLSLESMLELRRCRWLHKVAQMPEERIPRQLFAAWHHSNRRRGRPYQTIRHGYSNTLRRLGFEGDDCNILDRWMPLARDTQRWAQRVEWKLELQPGSFISMYHG